jgi:hypothetical protein
MIVSTTSASVTLELVLVLCAGGGGATTSLVGILPGATASLVGMLPAKAVMDISPVRATANTTDFMFGLLFD